MLISTSAGLQTNLFGKDLIQQLDSEDPFLKLARALAWTERGGPSDNGIKGNGMVITVNLHARLIHFDKFLHLIIGRRGVVRAGTAKDSPIKYQESLSRLMMANAVNPDQ